MSDRVISVKRGIIEILNEGEAVVAYKGFVVSDLFNSKKGRVFFLHLEGMKTTELSYTTERLRS